ncbi:MAG: Smr/MutS family protein [Paludibacteraceae bacterium]
MNNIEQKNIAAIITPLPVKGAEDRFFEHKIQFTDIRKLLTGKCLCSLGAEKVESMVFSSDFEEIIKNISETDEMSRLLFSETDEVPISNFYDIRPALARVRIEGLFLDEAELFDLYRAIIAVTNLTNFISRQDISLFPYLHKSIEDISSFGEITKRIDRILDKFGKIKDNATHELAHIRKDIIQIQSSISRTLMSILKQAQADGYVEKDLAPTMREGRLVIPVSPSFKRKINGIVHDESATGKTVFIEPQQVVEANNKVRELESEERREIIRILTEITNHLRPNFEEIVFSQYFLGKMDFLRAKALFASEIKAIKPQITNICEIDWIKAVHPLLYLALKKQHKDVVPLDIKLNAQQRILLISGPNAGGKSVCLKTVVMLRYMMQCGLPVPLHENSRMGIFERLFIDIGDEQSIENDLSTYSSHLLNMKFFIKNCNEKTLLLIDEFGTGTEPQIGGAIAETTLERFNANKTFGVITTHYTNLKHYAEDTEGIINGAMLYDRQHLQPLFQLEIGNPGSSFAVEIARKIGLPEDLINDAANKVGQEHLDYDKHLQDIVRDKRYWERKRQEIRQKEKRLNETLGKYETELGNINKVKKEIITQAKADAEHLLKEANAKIENTIRQIKEANAEKEKTREIRKNLDSFKASVNPLNVSQEDVARSKTKKNDCKSKKTNVFSTHASEKDREEILKAGNQVRLKGQNAVGEILEIQGNQGIVAFGQLKSTVKLGKLERISNNQLKQENRFSHLGKTVTDDVREKKLTFKSEIDVRGMRGEEALQAVTYFIDDAQMVGVSSVRILHGTGTGVLRQLIRQYLSSVYGVKSFRDEHIQFGGAGITVVEFD